MWSVNVGKIVGIPIRLDITFILLIFLTFFGGFELFVLMIILFFIVLFHELCHSIVALKYGVKIESITLFPLGGLSQMEEIPKKNELAIAAIGPLANFLLAGVFFIVVKGLGHEVYFTASLDAKNLINSFFSVNILLGLFNLLPAFPLDGGRILRSLLAERFDYAKATHISVKIGQAISFGLVFIGAIYNWFLIVIALFIFLGGLGESSRLSIEKALDGMNVKDVMRRGFVVIDEEETVSMAIEKMKRSREVIMPVVSGKIFKGALGIQDISPVKEEIRNAVKVKDIYSETCMVLSPDAQAGRIYLKMELNNVDVAFITEDDKITGMLYRRDFMLYTELSK
ncbi:MAG: M50 family metallopeptidase [Candidatus Methanofastidiosia archaeon]